MNEIKRKVELWLCSVLSSRIPGQKFLPAKGGDDANDGTTVEPPFTVVEAKSAEKVLPCEPTWTVEITVTYVTHIDDTSSPAHSQAVRVIYDQLEQLPRGYFGPQQLTVHGTDITETDEIEDEKRQSHGDVIGVTIGCSG